VRAPRSVALAAGVSLLLAGFGLAACGGGGNGEATDTTATETTATQSTTQTTPPAQPTAIAIRVVGGVPKGGIVRRAVKQGDRVVIVVNSDVADEVHVHGYDLMRDVAAGGTVRIPFQANLPGRFEIELESRGVQIADLTVNP
jgi:hypothetical protein